MLAGHYAPAFLIKARYPETRLWVLFLAVQAVDIVFFMFAVTGVEKMSVVDGSGPLAMHLEHVPLTHSLLMNSAFAFACVAVGAAKKHLKLGLLIGAALLSHWLLDVIVHLPDLPLLPWREPKVGLGFWQLAYPSLILELLLVAGAYMVARATFSSQAARSYADKVVVALLLIQVSYVVGPTMPTVWAMAAMAEAIYLGFIAFSWGIERRLDLTP